MPIASVIRSAARRMSVTLNEYVAVHLPQLSLPEADRPADTAERRSQQLASVLELPGMAGLVLIQSFEMPSVSCSLSCPALAMY